MIGDANYDYLKRLKRTDTLLLNLSPKNVPLKSFLFLSLSSLMTFSSADLSSNDSSRLCFATLVFIFFSFSTTRRD